MKTTKQHKSKIRFLIPMILLVFASSCKKDKIEEIRPKSFADFEKILDSDSNIQILIAKTNLLFLERASDTQLYPSTSAATSTKIYITPDQAQKIKSEIKSKDDALAAFNKYGISNPSIKLDLIEDQIKLIIAFSKDYPELSKLSKDEINMLMTKIISKARQKQNPFNIYAKSNHSKSVSDDNGCVATYGLGLQICDVSYGVAMAGIWSDVLYASIFSVGFLAPEALAGGLISSAAAMFLYDKCYEWTATAFFICLNDNK